MSDDDQENQSGDDTFTDGPSSTDKTVGDDPSVEDAIAELGKSPGIDSIDKPEEIETFTSLAFRTENNIKVTHNRAICYQLLNILFSLSRYLESYYRYDDELAIRDDPNKSISIETYYTWVTLANNNIKMNLMSNYLPPTESYRAGMTMLMKTINSLSLNVDYTRLVSGSYQLSDYNLVRDSNLPEFRTDDEGDNTDIALAPVNSHFLEMILRRPFCTLGCYSMTGNEFTTSNLYCQSNWMTGNERYVLTQTINLTSQSTRELNDKQWLEGRANMQEMSWLNVDPAPLDTSVIPDLLKQKNISALPKVGRSADPSIRQVNFRTTSPQPSSSSSSTSRPGPFSSNSSSSSGQHSSVFTPMPTSASPTPIGGTFSSIGFTPGVFQLNTPLKTIQPLSTSSGGFSATPMNLQRSPSGSVNINTSYSP